MRLLIAALVAAVAASATASGAAAAQPRDLQAVDTLQAALVAEVNAVRRRHGLVPLRPSQQLAAAAGAHSRAMASSGFFAHASRDGTPFSRRVARFYSSRGYRSWSVGENLAFSTPTLEARQAVRMWLDSPGHRRNLLSPSWRELGVSAVRAEGAPGFFAGADVVVVTAVFGVRQ